MSRMPVLHSRQGITEITHNQSWHHVIVGAVGVKRGMQLLELCQLRDSPQLRTISRLIWNKINAKEVTTVTTVTACINKWNKIIWKRLIDGLIDWLTDWLMDWSVDYLNVSCSVSNISIILWRHHGWWRTAVFDLCIALVPFSSECLFTYQGLFGHGTSVLRSYPKYGASDFAVSSVIPWSPHVVNFYDIQRILRTYSNSNSQRKKGIIWTYLKTLTWICT
jgi:hypothetical protein